MLLADYLKKDVNQESEFTYAIKNIVANRGLSRVFITGQSLGGAVATVFFMSAYEYLSSFGIDLRCVTFDCPRLTSPQDLPLVPAYVKACILNILDENISSNDLAVELLSRESFVYVGSVISVDELRKSEMSKLSGALSARN